MAEWFKGGHCSNHIIKVDPNSFRVVGTADKIASNGEWSDTWQGKGWGPIDEKGRWLAIDTGEGDAWKISISAAFKTTPPPPAPAETK
jgi:hypothetical protein